MVEEGRDTTDATNVCLQAPKGWRTSFRIWGWASNSSAMAESEMGEKASRTTVGSPAMPGYVTREFIF